VYIFRFGDKYATLIPLVLKTLCEAAAPTDAKGSQQALATQYGGFVAITLFGPKAIDAFLLPLAIGYWSQWEKELNQTRSLEQRLDLQMCQQAVLVSLRSKGI
jgi:hypothetical protein